MYNFSVLHLLALQICQIHLHYQNYFQVHMVQLNMTTLLTYCLPMENPTLITALLSHSNLHLLICFWGGLFSHYFAAVAVAWLLQQQTLSLIHI